MRALRWINGRHTPTKIMVHGEYAHIRADGFLSVLVQDQQVKKFLDTGDFQLSEEIPEDLVHVPAPEPQSKDLIQCLDDAVRIVMASAARDKIFLKRVLTELAGLKPAEDLATALPPVVQPQEELPSPTVDSPAEGEGAPIFEEFKLVPATAVEPATVADVPADEGMSHEGKLALAAELVAANGRRELIRMCRERELIFSQTDNKQQLAGKLAGLPDGWENAR